MKKVFKCINDALIWAFGLVIILVATLVWLAFFILYPTKIEGRKNLRKAKGAVVACNHFSNIDGVIICAKLFKFTYSRKFLGKKELAKVPLFAWVLRGIGAIFIDRSTVDRAAMKEVDKNLKKGKKVILFPEGTRNKDTSTENMGAVKSGMIFFAKRASVPIIPMRFEHRSKMFRRNRLIIGEPYMVGENGKLSTDEEVILFSKKMDELLAPKTKNQAVNKNETIELNPNEPVDAVTKIAITNKVKLEQENE